MKIIITVILLAPCIAWSQSPSPSATPSATPTQQQLYQAFLARLQAQQAAKKAQEDADKAAAERQMEEYQHAQAITTHIVGKVLSVTDDGILVIYKVYGNYGEDQPDDQVLFIKGSTSGKADDDPINEYVHITNQTYQYTAASGASKTVHVGVIVYMPPPPAAPTPNTLRGTSLGAPAH